MASPTFQNARRLAVLCAVLITAGLAGCDNVTSEGGRTKGVTDGGVVLWQEVAAPPFTYHGVSGSRASNVVMVGEKGVILRWDGKLLKQEPSTTTKSLWGVHVVSDTLAYAVGEAGTVLRYDGKVWSSESSGVTTVLLSVWANNDDAFAVGEAATAVRRQAGAWKTVMVQGEETLFAVTDAGGVVAVGALGAMARWDGQRFTRRTINGFTKPLVGATAGGGGAYAVGLDGSLFSIGDGLDSIEGAPRVFLRSVSAPANTIWVVGWDGTIARRRGDTVFRYPPPQERWLNGVWAANDDDVWIVGAAGAVYHGPPDGRRDGGVK